MLITHFGELKGLKVEDLDTSNTVCKLYTALKVHLPAVSTPALMGVLAEDPEALEIIMGELTYEHLCIRKAIEEHIPEISPTIFLGELAVDAESLAIVMEELGL